MPPKGVSAGFKEHNSQVGSTWSTYEEEEQDVFSPRLFERLCIATSEAYALSNPAIVERLPDHKATGIQPLTADEINQYVPLFERLVNKRKVAADIRQGRLWRHSGKSRNLTLEKLIQGEISKAVRQVCPIDEESLPCYIQNNDNTIKYSSMFSTVNSTFISICW